MYNTEFNPLLVYKINNSISKYNIIFQNKLTVGIINTSYNLEVK